MTTGKTLIGRRRELIALRRRLARTSALVTVVGAGGLGKTSLVRHLCEAGGEERPWTFVPLEHAHGPAEAAAQMANALGLGAGAATTADILEGVGRAIERAGAVLALDNFEHLTEHALDIVVPLLAELRHGAVIVTSRAPLNLDAEEVFALEPLEVAAGIELFEVAAARARRSFRVRPENRAVVREIVEAVDGLPLAIELCAARVPLLGLPEVLSRTRRQLDLFGGGARDRSERHRTLRACIAASWDLLDEFEQDAFAQAALFRGSFDLPAAEAIIALGEGAPPVLDVASGLVNKSMLRLDADDAGGAGRLHMFASLHEFAREQLEGDDGASRDAVLQRYTRHFAMEGTRRARAASKGDSDALAWLRRERDNLVAAHEYALGRDGRTAVVVALAVDGPLYDRGPVSLHLRVLDGAVEEARELGDAELLAEALLCRGKGRHAGALLSEAEEDLRAAIDLMADVEEPPPRILELRLLATAALLHTFARSGRADEVLVMGPPAIARARAGDFGAALGRLLNEFAGALMLTGRLAEAEEHDHEALLVLRAAGDQLHELSVLADLAVIFLWQGRFDEATASARAALPVARALAVEVREALLNETIGLVAHAQGDLEAAAKHLEEAMRLAEMTGRLPVVERLRGDLAGLAITRGDGRAAIEGFDLASRRLEVRGDARMAGVFAALCAAAHVQLDDVSGAERALLRSEGLLDGRERSLRLVVAGFIAAARERAGQPQPAAAAEADAALEEMQRSRSSVLAEILRRQLANARRGGQQSNALRVLADGSRFRVPRGAPVSLERKPSLHPVLLALARKRLTAPGEVMDVDALFAAGWPDDDALPQARKNRVHVAIAALRKAGLKKLLLTRGGGYCIDPAHAVTVGDDVGEDQS